MLSSTSLQRPLETQDDDAYPGSEEVCVVSGEGRLAVHKPRLVSLDKYQQYPVYTFIMSINAGINNIMFTRLQVQSHVHLCHWDQYEYLPE